MTSPVTKTIDLSSPSLQKALNTLISNSGGLLKNLSSAKAARSESPPTEAANDDSPPYSSHDRAEYDEGYEPTNYSY